MTRYREQTEAWNEQIRRLSKAMSKLDKEEKNQRKIFEEQQKQAQEEIKALRDKEKETGEFYDQQIRALEKVDRLNRAIADKQEGQIDLASALSRGDVAAAAKAQQDMTRRSAEARQEEKMTAIREAREDSVGKIRDEIETKQEAMDKAREDFEDRMKNLTIEVNGELLTREQIQDRIADIEDLIYDQSLKEYELQKQITEEKKKQEELAKKLAKVQRVNDVLEIASSAAGQDAGLRKDELVQIVGQLDIIDTPESQAFKEWILANLDNLDSLSPTEFAQAIAPELARFTVASGERIGIDLGQVASLLGPSLASAAAEAAQSATQIASLGLNEELAEFVKNWEQKNPFSLLEKGTDKWVKQVLEGFAKFAKTVGSGGGGGGGGTKPKPGDPPLDIEAFNLPTRSVSQSFKEQRAKLKSRTSVQSYGDRKIKITTYYDETTGRMIPELTKYEELTTRTVTKNYPGGAAVQENETSFREINPSAINQELRATKQTVPGVSALPLQIPVDGKAIGEKVAEDVEQGFIGKVGSGAKRGLDMFLEGLKAGIKGEQVAPTGEAVADGIFQGMAQKIVKAPGEILGKLVSGIQSLFGIKSPASTMLPVGASIADGIFEGIKQKILGAPQAILDNLIAGFKILFGIKSPATTMEPTGTSLAEGVFEGIKKKILTAPQEILDNLITGFKILFGIASPATEMEGTGTSLAEGIFEGIKKGILAAPQAILDNLITGLKILFGIASPATEMEGTGSSLAGGIYEGMKAWLVEGVFGGFVGDYKEKLGNAFNDAKGWFEGLGDKIGGWVSARVRSVVSAVKREANVPREKPNGGRFGGLMRNSGGLIPGSGMVDVVPAMLTRGEFVVKKEAVERFLPLLQAINSPIAYNNGGIVGYNPIGSLANPALIDGSSSSGSGLSDMDTGGVSASEIKDSIEDIAEALKEGADLLTGQAGYESIGSLAQGILDQFLDGYSILADEGSGIPYIFSSIVDTLITFVDTVLSVFEGINTAMEEAIEGMRGKKREFIQKMREVAAGLIEAIKAAGMSPQKRAFGGTIQKMAFGGRVNYKGSTESPPGMMYGGKMKKMATGSWVPGTGMTDKVPALLTPGEFVVRKPVAQAYGPMLQSLNSNVFPTMNSRTPTASGLMTAVAVRNTSANGTVQYNYNLSVNAATNASPDDIARTVLYKINRWENRKVRGSKVGG